MKKFLGMTPENKSKDGEDKTILAIDNKQFWGEFDTRLEALGVPDGKKVRKAQAQVKRDIALEAMNYTGEMTEKSLKTTTLKCGTGVGSLEYTTAVSRTSPNPKAQKDANEPSTVVTYAPFSVREHASKPGDAKFKEAHDVLKDRIKKASEAAAKKSK